MQYWCCIHVFIQAEEKEAKLAESKKKNRADTKAAKKAEKKAEQKAKAAPKWGGLAPTSQTHKHKVGLTGQGLILR